LSALWEALMPRGVANRPGKKSGRPRAPAPLVTRALELVEAGTHSVEDAAEEVGLGTKTVYRAREGAGVAPEVAEPAPVSPGHGLALAPEIAEDIFAPPDPEQTAAIRLLVVRGTLPGVDKDGNPAELPVEFGADWIARVAEGEGITPGEVRRLLRAAAVEAGQDALPFELARERSIAVAERFLTMALEAHDGRAGLAAQTHIDRLRFSTSEPDPEGLSRAGVTALFQRVAGELAGVPGGVEALRRALGGG
jgi:hypothetical protein